MRNSVWKPGLVAAMAIAVGLALSGCGGAALFRKPDHIVTVEASATELEALVQSGLTADAILNDSLSVLRHRMELATGVPVTVERIGPNRVRMVIPDAAISQDAQRLSILLKAGGKLEFKMVEADIDPAALADGLAPPCCTILKGPDGYSLLAVYKNGGVKDGHVKDAEQVLDDMTEEPVVAIKLDEVGKRQFAKLTTQSVGKLVAIVLDGRVLTAPIVYEPIAGGMVQISGNMTVDEARQKADMIRAGYLPVSFTIIENKEAPRE